MVNRENLTDVRIYNCKFEDYRDTKVVDLTFTSIPYFDLELYSNCIHYDSFDQWKSLFIESLKSCKNCYINCNKDLSTILGWNNNIEYYLKSNTTHFEKTDEFKLEPIVKLS
jgi:hypothetical protein